LSVRAVAVRELKNRLSAYLRDVAKGEVVLVTDRGRVVAELRRPTTELTLDPAERALERLHAEGVLTPGLPQASDAYRRTSVRMRGDSRSLLDADRGER
jgi:antitoxin (DNA-binding transcriptional repressor) of toxin-antitoxin stability system